MALTGFEVLLYTITFLVPGYVLHSTLAAVASRKPVESDVAFLRFLTLGAVHNAPWAALGYWFFREHLGSRDEAREFASTNAFAVAITWLLIVMLSPFIYGIVYAHLRRVGVVGWAWRQIRLKPLNPTATAWDYGFERGWTNLYIGVILTDGSSVYGRFDHHSNASSGVAGRDIHIEEVWDVNEEGDWTQPDTPRSVTISGDAVQSVTFWGEPRR